jgi:ISXO2-like transposase domain
LRRSPIVAVAVRVSRRGANSSASAIRRLAGAIAVAVSGLGEQRGGNTVPSVFKSESHALSFIKARIAKGTVVNADESASWDSLHARYEMRRINHLEAYSHEGACTNWAELFFSRLRRAEIGHHHHVAGDYLVRYAQEAAWREDNRRVSNGEQVNRVAALALSRKPSVDFSGYWQRHQNQGSGN